MQIAVFQSEYACDVRLEAAHENVGKHDRIRSHGMANRLNTKIWKPER